VIQGRGASLRLNLTLHLPRGETVSEHLHQSTTRYGTCRQEPPRKRICEGKPIVIFIHGPSIEEQRRSPTMSKSRGWRSLRYRLLVIAALVICLTSLLASATSPKSTCCERCLERFQQCDSPDFICCQIYTSCIQQCEGGCPSCPN
jgi:hypothetical protein